MLTALGARETVLRGAGAEELRAAADRHGDDPLARLAEHCARRRMLLVLDNCEHVDRRRRPRSPSSCWSAAPGVTVLATSREPLGVPGELLRPVEPLPEPVALRLLADRGAAARPGFRVDATETAAACAEICRRLDGLPLAIELAAARLRMLTPRQIADRLDDRFRLLTSGSRTVLPRQQTLRAVVDWSWDLLDEAERAVLRRLSVFAGGCDLAAAEAVCADPASTARGGRLLGSLVDKSLVVAAPGPARRRDALPAAGDRRASTPASGSTRPASARGAERAPPRRTTANSPAPPTRCCAAPASAPPSSGWSASTRTCAPPCAAPSPPATSRRRCAWCCRCLVLADARPAHRGPALVAAAAALGPDPFAAARRTRPRLHERCTDTPPPMAPEQLLEARRGVRLVALASMDSDMEAWRPGDAGGAARDAHRLPPRHAADLPGARRDVVLRGDADRAVDALAELLDGAVRACRDFGYEWELACVLQLRSKILADRPAGWRGGP